MLQRLAAARATVGADVTIMASTSQPLIVQYADQVVVLERGHIIERGAPADLLASHGAFAALDSRWRSGLDIARRQRDFQALRRISRTSGS